MFNILFNPKKAERHPLEMIVIAIFYSSISLLIGAWVFPEYASLIAIFFTVISSLYVTQGALRREEVKEGYYSTKDILVEHKKALVLFLVFFIGVVISFSFWTYALPVEKSQEIFSIQQSVLEGIRGGVTGDSILVGELFSIIFNNNLKVLFVSFVIS